MEQIENIKKKVDEIKNSLNELKNNVSLSDIEKKNQAECLKAQAEATKQRIEIEINNLDNETKTEAQNLLNKSMDDITSLYNSIVNTTASVKPLTENKNIFVKAKDWI
jgi:archaellum component FlaC